MIDEQRLSESLRDFSAVKRYMEAIKLKIEKQDNVLISTLEKISDREETIATHAKKVLEAAVESEKNINIIKKQFMPSVMELVQKLASENTAMIKRIDSLEHQLKKLNK